MSIPAVIADRFELAAEVGRGSMGSVHRARDRTTGAEVAIKLVVLEDALDRGRFEREVELLAAVRHPNVVGYIAHGVVGPDHHFLAQEWIAGASLRHALRQDGITAAEAIVVVRDLAEALAAVHAHGVIHRDVKPDNMIVAATDPIQIKLVDFGIARRADARGRLTRTGVMIGTPSYMSPEQARGEGELTPAADVWALGCVLFECLGGRCAFAGRSATSIRTKVLLDEPPDLAVLCPEAPPELLVLVDRLLAKSAAARLVDGPAVAAALRALPEVPPGPRRRVGLAEPPTLAMPLRPRRVGSEPEPSVLVFLGSVIDPTTEKFDDALSRIAASHHLDVHLLEDGAAVLASRGTGRDAAVAAARAALELGARLPDAGIAVVGRGDSALAIAIDRGAAAVERATIAGMFAGVVDGANPAEDIQLDDVVADLIEGALEVSRTQLGPVLRRDPARS